MSGDYSRKRFNPEKHFQGVLRQQGRIDLDADWNEYVDIQDRRWRGETTDIVGRCGVPIETLNGFKIEGGVENLTVGAGRIYIDGLLAENHGATPQFSPALEENYGTAPLPVSEQPYGIGTLMPEQGQRVLAYLDVWRREVTPLQDPELIEPAVDVDTTTRYQTAWRVKFAAIDFDVTCHTSLAEILEESLPSAARLTTSTVSVSVRSLDNHLYRVEVHSVDDGEVGVKWSRENAHVGSQVVAILDDRAGVKVDSLGRDDVLCFKDNNWVEVINDHRELLGQAGAMRKVTVNKMEQTLTFTPALDDGLDVADHLRVIRWDQAGSVLRPDGTELVSLDAGDQGVIVLTAAEPSFVLEHGIQATLTVLAGGSARVVDYWCFAARTADADIERLDLAPPAGIHHHFCKLAIIEANGTIQDCRPVFPALTELTSLFYLGGDGQEASAGLSLPQPLQVGVARGQWPVSGARVRFTVVSGGGTLQGTGQNIVDVTTGADGVASCTWALGSAPVSQQVLVTLLDSSDQSLHLPIRFNARLGVSGLEAGVHIMSVTLAGGELLDNDRVVPANRLAEGLSIACDGAIEPDTVRNRPTCFVMLDLPYPFTDSDREFWETALIGYQPIHLAATVDANKNVITWTPTKPTQRWLAERLFPLMEKHKRGTRVLAHLTLLGNFIWEAGKSEVWVDGDLFGIRKNPGINFPTTGRWPTGDGRRGGDLHMWFWLVEPRSEPVTVTLVPEESRVVVGGQVEFTVRVTGTENIDVDMSVSPPVGHGTIKPLGRVGIWEYQAPLMLPGVNPVTIKATSVADSTSFMVADVTIVFPKQGPPQLPPRLGSQASKGADSRPKAAGPKKRNRSTPSSE